ncbi:MAG: hypothetical protein H6595_04625 [Flavobacteriales bacterium]|nr:hypothetical protein [Flavobacteriales bacterium]MCB9193094.1 hypothetical protein [Flavobacteriales bacterium]
MELSTNGPGNLPAPKEAGLVLATQDVLTATIAQLTKDLERPADRITPPPADPGAFEALRGEVLPLLQEHLEEGSLDRVLYRVDVPERWTVDALRTGGLHELAGRVVLRALQKVLTRRRFSGSGGATP